jgi:hypothetical protein
MKAKRDSIMIICPLLYIGAGLSMSQGYYEKEIFYSFLGIALALLSTICLALYLYEK